MIRITRVNTFLLIVALAATLTACAHRQAPEGFGGGAGGFAIPVQAQPLRRGTIAQTFTVTGSVTPLQQASLSSVASGTVLTVTHQIGQHVYKGELLVKIDDSTLRAQLQQNEAALESARAHLDSLRANAYGTQTSANAGLQSAKVADQTAQLNLSRTEALFKQGYVSSSALDQARQQAAAADAALRSAQASAQNAAVNSQSSSATADIKNAQAAVDQAAASVNYVQNQIAQTNVSAPFDGVLSARHVDPGALASPGTPLVDVAQLDHIFVDVGIAGDNLRYVHVGSPVTVTVDSVPNRAWHSRVQYLNPAAASGTLSYSARIPVSNPDLALHGGMVASVDFEQSRKNGVLLAPRAAVYETETGYAMFVIQQGKAQTVPVDLGLSNDQVAEVSGPGLQPGLMAILNHSVTLQPGSPVQVLPPPGAPQQGKNQAAKAY